MGTYCPLLKKTCIEHKCKLYVHLLGKNPQSTATIDSWDCAISFIPVLLIEGAQQTRQAGAAIESFRNEMVRGSERTQHLLATGQTKLLGGNGEIDDNPRR